VNPVQEKSTIFALLERFYDVENGVIMIDGVNLKELDPAWWHDQVALVSQEPTLFATSIRDNIAYGRPEATETEIIEATKAANAYNFIMGLPEKMNTEVGERGVQLSAGQKQRIAIARAILKNPRILLLDEATSALDTESEHLVQDALERLMVSRTSLIIAHRLVTVKNADQILVFKKGKIVERGNHEELLNANGEYAQLADRQLHLGDKIEKSIP